MKVLIQPFHCPDSSERAVQHRTPLKSVGAASGWGGAGLFVFMFCVLETGSLLCSPGY